MNTKKRPRRQVAELLLALPAALPASAAPQQAAVDCRPVQEMASYAYTELRNAILQRDFSGACRLRNVFWEIEKYGGGCQNIRKMASSLSERQLGRNDACLRLTENDARPGAGGSSGGSGSTGSETQSGNENGTVSASGASGSGGNTGASPLNTGGNKSNAATGR